MWVTLSNFLYEEGYDLLEWAKCGDSYITVTPTVLWAVGAAALSQRLLTSLFRRFLFRRVPLWEQILQNLLFIWMVMYSVHFWILLVKLLKLFVEYCYEDAFFPVSDTRSESSIESIDSQKVVQQWVIWMFGVAPLAVYFHTRPRPEPPPMMIWSVPPEYVDLCEEDEDCDDLEPQCFWITTNPWQRREMGPYGYYLNRPPSDPQPSNTQQPTPLRRAFSDSNLLIKEPPKRKRHSKSL